MSDLSQCSGAMVIRLRAAGFGPDERAYVRFVAQLYSIRRTGSFDLSSDGIGRPIGHQRLLSAEFPAKLVKQRLGLQVATSSTPDRHQDDVWCVPAGPAGDAHKNASQLFVNDLWNTRSAR